MTSKEIKLKGYVYLLWLSGPSSVLVRYLCHHMELGKQHLEVAVPDRSRYPHRICWVLSWVPNMFLKTPTCEGDASIHDSGAPIPLVSFSNRGALLWLHPVKRRRSSTGEQPCVNGLCTELACQVGSAPQLRTLTL